MATRRKAGSKTEKDKGEMSKSSRGKGKGKHKEKEKERQSDSSDSDEGFGMGHKVLPTSTKTLHSFVLPTDSEVRASIAKSEVKHSSQKKVLKAKYSHCHEKWTSDLISGNNLLFYGCGSKISLIEEYSKKALSKYPIIRVNGYVPSCSVKAVANQITENLLHLDSTFANVGEHCEFIHNLFSGSHKHLSRRKHKATENKNNENKNNNANNSNEDENKNNENNENDNKSERVKTNETENESKEDGETKTDEPYTTDNINNNNTKETNNSKNTEDTNNSNNTDNNNENNYNNNKSNTSPNNTDNNTNNINNENSNTNNNNNNNNNNNTINYRNSRNIPSHASRHSHRHNRPSSSKHIPNITVPSHLFIIIHNIDGPNLKSKSSQSALASLASAKNIHFIASIDTMTAPIYWDLLLESLFSWVWYDVTTYDQYKVELTYRSIDLRGAAPKYAQSVANARAIFRVLAAHQLESQSNKTGMPLDLLFSKCRDAFVVSSELTLRAQLIEFKEHQVIKEYKDHTLYIPLDNVALQQLLEDQTKNIVK